MGIIPGGLWFKDHCLEITPYIKKSGIRYHYESEEWVTVDGDDYSIEYKPGQCYVGYKVDFEVTVRHYWLDYDRITIVDLEDHTVNLSITTPVNVKISKPPHPANITKITQLSEVGNWNTTDKFQYCDDSGIERSDYAEDAEGQQRYVNDLADL